MRFAETNGTSAEASISAGTFTAPTLIGMLDDAEHLGYVSIRGGEYHGAIPAGLDTLCSWALILHYGESHTLLGPTW